MIIRNTINFLTISLLLVVFTACDTTPEKQPQPEVATNAIKAAQAAQKRAVIEGYAWRDTAKLIKQAKKALVAGKDNKAVKLANKARRQAENAVKQKYSELKRLEHMFPTRKSRK